MGLLSRLIRQTRRAPAALPLEQLPLERSIPVDDIERMARARQLGFDADTPLYHGTDQVFSEFQARPGWFGTGVYASRSPKQAGYYTRRTAHQARGSDAEPAPNIMPLMARGPLATHEEWQRTYRSFLPRRITKFDPKAEERAMQRAQEELMRRGYSGVDAGGVDDEVLIFDPANVRSRFADFDPARSGSRDIMAGALLALPVGGGLLSARERNASR